MYKAKKRIASTVAESQLGRKIIQYYLGHEGIKMFDAIKTVISKHTNEDDANKIEQTSYKMVMKAKFMLERKLITPESAEPLAASWSITSKIVLLSLRPESEEDMDIAALSEKLNWSSDLLQEILSQNMTEKNASLLKWALNYICDVEFMRRLVSDPAFEKEKNVLFENLKSLLPDEEIDPTMPLAVQVRQSPSYFVDKYSSVVRVVQEFWPRSVSGRDKTLVAATYDNIINLRPEYAELFPSKDRTESISMLLEVLRQVIFGLNQFEVVAEKIKIIGKCHHDAGIPIEAYDHGWVAFDASLRANVGMKYNTRVQTSVRFVYEHIIGIIKTNYKTEEEDTAEQKANDDYKQIQKFWRNVVMKQEHYVSHTLYEYLFDLHPSYKDFFPGKKKDDVEDQIMKMFCLAIDGLDDEEELFKYFSKLGAVHYRMKIPPKGFAQMWDALDLSLMLAFGGLYELKIKHSLSNIIHRLIEVMLESYPHT